MQKRDRGTQAVHRIFSWAQDRFGVKALLDKNQSQGTSLTVSTDLIMQTRGKRVADTQAHITGGAQHEMKTGRGVFDQQ